MDAPPPLSETSNTWRPLLRLAWPVFAEEVLNMLVGYTDWWLAGHFLKGAEYGAAMGLMAYSMWLIPSIFSAISIGAVALISRLVGGGQSHEARRVVGQSILIGMVFALLGTIGVWQMASTFAAWMQLEPAAAELAVRYLYVIVPVIPLIMLEQVGIACLRGAGDTRTGLMVKVLVNVVNTVLSAGLLLGLGPLPKLGWEGLAVGTACGHGLAGLILAVILLRGRTGLKLELPELRPNVPLMKRLMRVGIPGGLDMLAMIACHLIYLSIINRLGTVPAAAHGLALRIEALAYLPGSAFQVAAATMTGQLLGAGQLQLARRSAISALLMGGSFMCGSGLLLFFGGGLIAKFFTNDASNPVSQLAGQLLPIVACGMPFFAIVSVFAGVLRGAGDTRWPLMINFAGLIAIRIPLAAYLAWETVPLSILGVTIIGWNLGAHGAWYAMIIDIAVRSTLIGGRFLSGRWQRVKV